MNKNWLVQYKGIFHSFLQKNLKKAISYKAKYIKRRHDLSVDIIGKVRKEFFEKDLALFEKKYNEFKKSIKKEKNELNI